jgi:hypothetical protein
MSRIYTPLPLGTCMAVAGQLYFLNIILAPVFDQLTKDDKRCQGISCRAKTHTTNDFMNALVFL